MTGWVGYETIRLRECKLQGDIFGWGLIIIVLLVLAVGVGGLVFLITYLSKRSVAPGTPAPYGSPDSVQTAPAFSDPASQLRKLEQMRNEGLLTEQEYEAKRAEVLSRI